MLVNQFFLQGKKKCIEHLLCANPVLGAFPKFFLLNVLKLLSELGTVSPILKREKLRLREAEQLPKVTQLETHSKHRCQA